MMSASNVSASAASSGYYKAEGYYIAGSPEAEAAASWFGQAAQELAGMGQSGFTGRVDDQTFSDMLNGFAPPTEKDERGQWQAGQQLGRIVDGARQHCPGIDLTFSASKSVSILALVGGDQRVLSAHDEAVKAAMTFVEARFITTRKEVNGEILQVPGKMIAGLFRHDTSRALDPQLHTHAVVQNMVLREDGKWSALSNEQIYRNKMLIGAVYRNELAQRLEAAGYQVDRVGPSGITEIRGVPQHLMDGFSKRRQEIEAALADRGRPATAVDSALAALATRRNKAEGVDRQELQEAWQKEAATLGVTRDELMRISDAASRELAVRLPGVTREGLVQPETRAERALADIEFAIQHVSERHAVYSQTDLLKTALNRTRGASIGELEGAIQSKEAEGRLVPVHVHDWKQGHRAESFQPGEGFTGKLVDHGPAPYMNDRARRQSYFVTLEIGASSHTFWGADLASAIGHSAPETGSTIHMAVEKSTPVAVQDEKTGQTVASYRNSWRINTIAGPGDRLPLPPRTVQMYSDNSTLAQETQVLREFRRGRREGGVKLQNYIFGGGSAKRSGQNRLNVHLDRSTLSEGQKDAVKLGLSAAGRFVGVQGYAGTGKTFMLETLRKHAEKAGYSVEGAAPTNKAAVELQAAIPGAMTVARHQLIMEGAQGAPRKSKTILIIDEAGMLSTRDMKAVLASANATKYARVLLVGDVKQLDAVSAGNPFQPLQKAGMPTALMADIQRQRDSPRLRDAVLHAIRGEVKDAFDKISSVSTPDQGHSLPDAIADRWLSLHRSVRDHAGIVVLTNKMRREVNRHIRDGLRAEGQIGSEETRLQALAALNLTRAEARDAGSYAVEDRVVPIREIGGLSARTIYRVTATDTRRNTIELQREAGGETIRINLTRETKTASSLASYEVTERRFAAGDRVKFTVADRDAGISKGARGVVAALPEGQVAVRLQGGRAVRLPEDGLAGRGMDHAYAATAHDFQGATVDKIIIGMSAHETLSHQKSFYVNISRAKDSADLITDKPSELADRIEKNTGERPTALDAYAQKLQDDRQRQRENDRPTDDQRRQEAASEERRQGRDPREDPGPDNRTEALIPYPSRGYGRGNADEILREQFEKASRIEVSPERTDRQLEETLRALDQKQKTREGPTR